MVGLLGRGEMQDAWRDCNASPLSRDLVTLGLNPETYECSSAQVNKSSNEPGNVVVQVQVLVWKMRKQGIGADARKRVGLMPSAFLDTNDDTPASM